MLLTLSLTPVSSNGLQLDSIAYMDVGTEVKFGTINLCLKHNCHR